MTPLPRLSLSRSYPVSCSLQGSCGLAASSLPTTSSINWAASRSPWCDRVIGWVTLHHRQHTELWVPCLWAFSLQLCCQFAQSSCLWWTCSVYTEEPQSDFQALEKREFNKLSSPSWCVLKLGTVLPPPQVALVFPNNDPVAFMVAFYGCLLAEVVPVPIEVPLSRKVLDVCYVEGSLALSPSCALQ